MLLGEGPQAGRNLSAHCPCGQVYLYAVLVLQEVAWQQTETLLPLLKQVLHRHP